MEKFIATVISVKNKATGEIPIYTKDHCTLEDTLDFYSSYTRLFKY